MDIAIAVCLDILVIAVLAVFAGIGVRKGLLRSVVGFGGCIIAVLLAIIFSSQVGSFICEKYVYEPVRNWTVNQLTSDPEDVKSDENDIDFDGLFADKPEFFKDMCSYLNVGIDSLENIYNEKLSTGIEQAKQSVVDAMAKPIAESLSKVIAFALIFVATWIIIGIIWVIVSVMSHIPVIRHFDKLGGGILGLLRGILVALVLVAVIHGISPYVFKDKSLSEKQGIFDRTVVYEVFYKLNPFNDSVAE